MENKFLSTGDWRFLPRFRSMAQYYDVSHRTRKPTICISENEDADQLCSNCTADTAQQIGAFVFCYKDSTIPLLACGLLL